MNRMTERRTVAALCAAAVLVVALCFFAPDIVARVSAPAEIAALAVADAGSALVSGLGRGEAYATEIQALKAENAGLKADAARIKGLEKEVDRLRDVLDLVWDKRDVELAEAELLSVKGGAFRSVFTFLCREARPGELLVNEQGVVGIVSAFEKGVGEAISVLDPGFSVGVRSAASGEPAVASGDFELMAEGRLSLSGARPGVVFEEGDLMLTMNEGFPVGFVDFEGHLTPATDLTSRFLLVKTHEND